MAFLGRILRYLLLFVIATWLARRLMQWLSALRASRKEFPTSPTPVQLRRDPWCGTYVSPEISHSLEQAGQVIHFCSAECRERYQASLRRAASG